MKAYLTFLTRWILAVTVFIFLVLPSHAQSIAATWTLVEARYNNNSVEGLEATLTTTDVDFNDSLNYSLSFNDGVNSGLVKAKYKLENGHFTTNLTGENIVLNGFSQSSIIGTNGLEIAYQMSLNIALNAFNQWGGTLIGYGDPDYNLQGNTLTFTNANGSTVITFEKENISSASEMSKNGFRLYPNYPNPFYSSTIVSFFLPTGSPVNVSIFDAAGNHVETLVEGNLPPGEHTYSWRRDFHNDGEGNGIYYCVMRVDGQLISRKIVAVDSER
ncbi:MAG: T9SS type A sorting domain-containing protein [Lewinellaceae bacterium]|nr:T9SS type A sorting domain-containing protein [Phaeodactylibacter sp.]MCB9345972.1 T9SS type A sorting domain-containing protein [Lewinellaceae bacterium]